MSLVHPGDRGATYGRLVRRNRFIGLLRLAVPASGAVILAALLVQIYVSSLGNRYGVGQITVTPDAIVVEAPEYAGILGDGSSYRVFADEARANKDNTDMIGLGNAAIVLNRADGVQMQAETGLADLDTLNQAVITPESTDIADSLGTQGTLGPSVFDWQNKVLTSEGPVDILYADGTTIRADGLVYDLDGKVWSFSRASVVLPSTPGETLP
ncbi:hypothetical protein SAMN05216456_3130 [Devosia crocina]|uniref:Lipopolysaccharide export system protein LptC n=1 Tax=Devosia crocina TaxID=429728 RepID=A0A1I7NT56_9HYPH|nr:hypothetical protein [Devosia crocina]SFV37846.1 hypothetical protein SAMN05216456_3130 [Devosia crocina]